MLIKISCANLLHLRVMLRKMPQNQKAKVKSARALAEQKIYKLFIKNVNSADKIVG